MWLALAMEGLNIIVTRAYFRKHLKEKSRSKPNLQLPFKRFVNSWLNLILFKSVLPRQHPSTRCSSMYGVEINQILAALTVDFTIY